MTVYRFHSTMLVENVEVTFDPDEDDDFEEFIDKAKTLNSEHEHTAEFRVTIDDPAPTCADAWLLNQLAKNNVPALEILSVLYAAENWGDSKTVMAAHYGSHYDSADSIISAVDAGDYCIDYNKDENEAYSDFGGVYCDEHDEDLNLNGHEDCFDFEKYGREIADDVFQYVDNNYYVLKEWH
jgi:hypothetical protein